MGVKDFFKKMRFGHQLNIEDGRFELLGLRGLILPAFIYTWLFEEIYEIKGEDAFDLLFEIGKRHAKTASEEVFSKYKVSKRKMPTKMFDAMNLMGLGRMEMHNYNYNKSHITITVNGSVFAEQFAASSTFEELDRTVDDYLVGLIHGYMSKVFNDEVQTVEEQCEFNGADHCTIKVRPKSS